MNRPYIVCYMMTSVDGRIDCAMTEQLPGVEDYYPLLDRLGLHSAVSGRTTAQLELAEPGAFCSETCTPVGARAVSKRSDGAAGYSIVADTRGTLLWRNDSEYEQPHIILTSEQVSREYLAYLDEKHISYIAVGEQRIDLAAACEVLRETFGVERLGVVGGPAINTAFLDAGLLDEVIVLIGAGIDARAAYPTVFQRPEGAARALTRLTLIEARAFDSGAVMIRYKTDK